MIPIFIITCNRLEVLKQSIKSYHDCIKTPHEIVIVDFGSTYEFTIEFLRDLERRGIKVYRNNRIRHLEDLNYIDHNIQDYFKNHPASNYVVTDPDVELDNVEGDILDIYGYLLEALPRIVAVGPMLKIDDIPDHYHNKRKVQVGHYRGFWSKKINSIKYKRKTIKFIYCSIDTTFAMNRAKTHWKRLQKSIRTMSPYSARHLDWYLDPKNLTPDQEYYIKYASRAVAHWSMEDY